MGLRKFHIIAAMLAGIIVSGSTIALAALEKDRYSSVEKIGFAFYDMSGATPDFMSWITPKEKYRNAYPLEKQKIVQHELQRLKTGLLQYDRDSDLVKLETQAQVDASNFFTESQKEGRETQVKITLKDVPKNNFFPFQIGEVWVAVVVQDLDFLTNLTFNAEEYADFAAKLSLSRYLNIRTAQVNIDFTLRPLSVDTSAPIELEGLEMWLMLAEVAHMEIWKYHGKERQYLWEYKAPWYTSVQEKELRNLYWQK